MSHETYWQKKLAGNFAKKSFPYDYKESALNERRIDCERFEFPQDVVQRLETFWGDSNMNLYKILVSGIAILLSKYTYGENTDIIVGAPFRKGVEHLANIALPIKTCIDKNQAFKELFIQVGQAIDEAYKHEDHFMEVFLRELILLFPYEGFSLFDVAVSLEDIHEKNCLRYSTANTKFLFKSTDSSIEGIVSYNASVYERTTIRRMICHLVNLLRVTLADMDIRLIDIDILSEEDKKQLLFDCNDTETGYPGDKAIHDVFLEQVEKRPDSTAVIYQDAYLSYKELDCKANRAAVLLQKKGINRDEPVGIMAPRSLEMVIGLLGILKAGGAYLPINFDYPEDRKKYILENANIRVLFTSSPEIFKDGLEIISLYASFFYQDGSGEDHIPSKNTRSNDAAYIMFTSGSSGKPKGVIVEHRGVVRLVKNTDYITFNVSERILQTGALEFDASTFEIWGSLLNGLTLCLVRNDDILAPENLKRTLLKYDVDTVLMTSAFLNQVADVDSRIFSSLDYLLTGGDVLSPVHINRVRSACPRIKIINCYGPTENTTISTTYRIAKDHEDNIPIGKPIANSTCYIVDENLHLLPLGVPGELVVGGDGVARGYLNQPELTAERFILPSVTSATRDLFEKRSLDPQKLLVNDHSSFTTHHSPLYKTGDLARWLPEVPPAGGAAKGIIEFLGRIDQQVKIRGFRIEPGEIENRLLKFDHIKEAIVVDLKDAAGEKYLCAYMTAAVKLDIPGIREKLSGLLPGFMIPSYFMQLDKIPLNVNGKIDRQKLPAPLITTQDRAYIKPRNAIEEKLAETWAKTLNRDKNLIGIDDDFFTLGGHSLKAAMLVASIHKIFHVKIQIPQVFQLQTIRKQAEYIKTAEKNKYSSIEPTSKKEYYPLSSAQKRIYFMSLLDKQSTLYHNQLMEVYHQLTDKERLESAFKKLIARHESLRTTFHLVEGNGEPVQKVHDYKEVEPLFKIEYYDTWEQGMIYSDQEGKEWTKVTGLPIQDVVEHFVRPFDLSKPLLIRVGLITVIKSHQVLMVDMHHIISDGVSLAIMLEELSKLYDGENLEPLTIQYKDFAEWSHNPENIKKIISQEDFWLKELAGEIPVLHLPIDYPRPPVMAFEGDTLDIDIDARGLRDLYRQAQSNGVTLFMILLAAYNVLLAKLSGQEEIITGTVTAGRGHIDLQKIVGMFVNTLALRNYPNGEKTFKEFLLEIKESTLAAFENQDYPFDLLVSKIAPRKDAGRNPLFDVALELHNESDHKEFLQDVLLLDKENLYDFNVKKSKFEVSLIAVESHDSLFLKLEYNTQLFKKETAERFLGYYKRLLVSICRGVEQEIAGLEMIPEEERNKLIYEFNNVEWDYPQNRTIHSLFEEQAVQKPNNIAVVGIAYNAFNNDNAYTYNTHSLRHGFGEKNEKGDRRNLEEKGEKGDRRNLTHLTRVTHLNHLTYRELNLKAGQVAGRLRASGIKPGDIAAIMVEPSLEMFIGILAILKAGGAFLPIKDGTPTERIKYILQESGAPFLLTRPPLVQALSFDGTILHLDDPALYSLYPEEVVNPISGNTSRDIAYVIYTSGSTGRPKGVIIEHRSLVNLCSWHNKYLKVTANDRATKYAGFGFDASVIEIFPILVIGAAIYIVPEEIKLDIQALNHFYEDNGITVSFLPTQVAEQFITVHNKSLRILQTAGDKLKIFVKRNYQLYNCYGPTENTVCTSIYPVTESSGNIPIGKPIANHHVYILDRNNYLQPIGIPGELCIGGDGVARGYLNNPELTCEKFGPQITLISQMTQIKNKNSALRANFQHSAFSIQHSILYCTGDLARWLPDGNIEFLGRLDSQVKIRGFRIELGEIENQLLHCKKIKEAVVLAREDTPGQKYLCAYIVPIGALNIGTIKDTLLKNLPDYMVPSFFVKLEKIPLTPNGKIDTRALPAPGIIANTAYEAPTNKIEEILAQTWAEVLDVRKIGIHDNFFEVGGDSIKTILIISRLSRWGLTVKVNDFFLYPTIHRLAKQVIQIVRIPDQGVITGKTILTPIQCWFFENHFPYAHHFNQSLLLARAKGFNEDYIKKVFTRLISHHDALRMIYKIENGAIVQENRGIDGKLFDLAAIPLKSTGEEAVSAEIKEQANRLQSSMDLQNGPLVKLGLFKGMGGDYLLIVIHHLVIDGVSWRILQEDFETGYRQAEKGREIKFRDKTDSFQYWASKLIEYAASKSLLKELPYWRNIDTVDAVKVNDLPVDHEIESGRRLFANNDTVPITLSQEKTRQLLTKTNWAYNTEINDILLAALGLAIKQWAGIDKIPVTLEGHGREQINADVNINRTVGWFTSKYPVLLDMEKAEDISFTVKNVKETLRRIPNKGIGSGILQYLTPPEKKEFHRSNMNPEILFNYLGQFGEENDGIIDRVSEISAPGTGDNVAPAYVENHKIVIEGETRNGQLNLVIFYNKCEYERKTIERLAQMLETSLANIIDHCLAKKEKELTPSDLGYHKISLAELSGITRYIKDHTGEDMEIQAIYPLSPMQSGMLFHWLKDKKSAAYFEQIMMTFRGEIHPPIFEEALNIIAAHFDALRTLFTYEGLAEPLQIVLKQRKTNLHFEDISHFNELEQEQYLEEAREKDRQRSFDLTKDYLTRFSLFKTGAETHIFVWTFHHTLLDGWCLGIIRQELLRIYRLLEKGQPVITEPFPPYVAYIRWLEKQDKEQGLLYWEKYLEGYEEPARLPRLVRVGQGAKEDGYRKADYHFFIAGELVSGLNRLAGERRVTVNTLFQTLWGILLQRYNNRNDVVFGAIVSGRPAEINGIERMVGLFINMVPVRIKSVENQGFGQLLEQVQAESLEAQKYEYLPAAEVQARSQLKGDLIDHIIIFENYLLEKQAEEGLIYEDVKGFEQTNYDFNIIVLPWNGLHMQFSYNALVYDKNTIENIGEHFIKGLSQVIANPDILIKKIDILSEAEKEKVLFAFNNTKADYPSDKTIHGLFEDQVERTPDSTATIFRDTRLTYRELNEKANRLANRLREKGVRPDQIVGLMVERSMEMIIGMMAILKAGGGYLPIDPNYPPDRIRFMVADSNIKLLLAQEPFLETTVLGSEALDIHDKSLYQGGSCNSAIVNTSKDIAYSIYTSGSTGKPKGVAVEHRSVINLAYSQKKSFEIVETDNVLQFSSINFDASEEQIYICLFSGASLVLVDKKTLLDMRAFEKFINDHTLTHINGVPSYLKNIPVKKYKNLKRMIAGGDVCTLKMVKEWTKYCDFYNQYGPTETTVTAIKFLVKKGEGPELMNLPIGKALHNTYLYLLDTNMRIVPIGVPGELFIGGDGVARGYLNQPELTAEKFIDLHHSSFTIHHSKFYRTGDLARWLPDGNIEFLGRSDDQVKIRGFRIELGEIERELLKLKGIKEAAILAKENKNAPGEKYLCAYLVSGKIMDTTSIRNKLAEKLPAYMIPAYFVQLEKMPLNPNGKLDRKSLPEPGKTNHQEYIPPANETEKLLAEVWEEVLNKKIGIHDHFFEIGGDSIKIILIAGRLQKRQVKININDFFAYRTIHELAHHINDINKSEESQSHQAKFPIRDESLIAIDIQRDYDHYLERVKQEKWPTLTGKNDCGKNDCKQILISGATGYLGAYITYELLRLTDATLYLPIRGNSQAEAEKRLKEKMAFYFGPGFFNTQQHRLMIIKSNLAEKGLGLSSTQYKELSGAVDTVIHSAAKVKHFGDYREFYKDNVAATEELLKFAGTGRKKTFHHISTMDTGTGDIPGRDYLVFTEYTHDEGQKSENVYVKSKLAAEKQVLAYREKGLEASIYRVGNITFHSETGRFQENIEDNFFYAMLKAFIKVGFWTDKMKTLPFDLSFVDLTARAIVLLLTQTQLKNETYHICNPHILSWQDMGMLLKELGITLPGTETGDIHNYLIRFEGNSEYEKIIERVKLYSWIWGGKPATLTVPKMDRTVMLLEKRGFQWPQVTMAHIKKMIDHCQEVGFISIYKN